MKLHFIFPFINFSIGTATSVSGKILQWCAKSCIRMGWHSKICLFIDSKKQVQKLAVICVFGHAKTLCVGGIENIEGSTNPEMDDSPLLSYITTGQNLFFFSFSGSDAAWLYFRYSLSLLSSWFSVFLFRLNPARLLYASRWPFDPFPSEILPF